MPESIYPDKFFNISHPSSPVIDIQFRTEIGKDNDKITDSKNWTSINFNPNNFFNSFELEDNGGFYTVNLSLFDQNFTFLEDVIIRAIVNTRLNNKLIKDESWANKEPSFFEFFVSKKSSVNMRIRFGYSDASNENYINSVNIDDPDWVNRVDSEKPVIKTPWLYFQISGGDYNFTPKGLELNIKAFSVTQSFLDSAKLVQTYTKITGPPKGVITGIMNKIIDVAKANNETITFEILEEPRVVRNQNSDNNEDIEIFLGGQPTINNDGEISVSRRYKSLRKILNEICAAIKPMKYDEKGNEVKDEKDSSSDASGEDDENEKTIHSYPYSYSIEEKDESTNISFYYQDPSSSYKNQKKARTYVWLQDGKSIVKNLDLKTETDFATLNVPIVSIDEKNGELSFSVATGNKGEDDFSVGNLKNVSDSLSQGSFDGILAREVVTLTNRRQENNSASTEQISQALYNTVISNLNKQIFTGTLTIPGDPFYLFGSGLQPFKYLINIIVNRPNFLDKDGNLIQGGKSYLSGYYAITKIFHRLSYNGYETELSLMRFNRR